MPSLLSGRYPAVKVRKKLYVTFCLKNWVNVDGKLMFRKVTFKHCYECIHADEIEGAVS